MPDKPIKYEVSRWPPEDDPGWYEADVWDCPKCGVTKIDAECVLCPGCLAKKPEGEDVVYRGRCWGMKLVENPEVKLTDLKLRPLVEGPRDETLENIKDIDDEDFLAALRNAGSLK